MIRSENVQTALDKLGILAFGRTNTEAIQKGICISCGKAIDLQKGFKDALSRKEYGISGLCQPCQDVAFQEELWQEN
jgi:hypothetical protein